MRMLLAMLVAVSVVAHISENASDLLQVVKFQSSNFENILTWDSGPQTPPDMVYSVEYKSYGEKDWLSKEGCQRITRKSCNLTMETGNFREPYYARVNATSAGGKRASKMTQRFISERDTTIKAPAVTCIPKVRSIQMIIHPTSTPIQTEDGHHLTLEDIFQDLSYRLKLQVNSTYQVHLEGSQREYEFVGLPPDTEFIGTAMIWVPSSSKMSPLFMCQVKTMPDQTWTYSFLGVGLFFVGFLVASLCYVSYRYITKPPPPPKSLNVQHVPDFQPLQLDQEEHTPTPVSELSIPSGAAQPVQYAQIMVSRPKEPAGAPPPCSLSEVTYLGPSDIILQPSPSKAPAHDILTPLPYAPQAATDSKPPSYAPQVTPEAKPVLHTPQTISGAQPSSSTLQAFQDSWLPSYGMCVEDAGKDSLPGTLSRPKQLQLKGQLHEEAPAVNGVPGGFSPQRAKEEPKEMKYFHQSLGTHMDPSVGHRGDPGTPGHFKDQLFLLSSVQLEGHPVSLPLHTSSLPCSPTDQSLSPWGLLESFVCPKDKGSGSETESTSVATRAANQEQPAELGSLFRDLDLTVQWGP